MIPFIMNIKQYYTDGTYEVEYIPKNIDCIAFTSNIKITTPDLTNEQILDQLKMHSPQLFWEQQLAAKNIQHNVYSGLVNTSHDVSTLPNTIISPDTSTLTPSDIKDLISSITGQAPLP